MYQNITYAAFSVCQGIVQKHYDIALQSIYKFVRTAHTPEARNYGMIPTAWLFAGGNISDHPVAFSQMAQGIESSIQGVRLVFLTHDSTSSQQLVKSTVRQVTRNKLRAFEAEQFSTLVDWVEDYTRVTRESLSFVITHTNIGLSELN
jgi:hypothetical protein